MNVIEINLELLKLMFLQFTRPHSWWSSIIDLNHSEVIRFHGEIHPFYLL